MKKKSNLTVPEIAEIADKSIQSVSRIIRDLIVDVSENIRFRELTPEEKKEKYGRNVNSRIRIYWLEN